MKRECTAFVVLIPLVVLPGYPDHHPGTGSAQKGGSHSASGLASACLVRSIDERCQISNLGCVHLQTVV